MIWPDPRLVFVFPVLFVTFSISYFSFSQPSSSSFLYDNIKLSRPNLNISREYSARVSAKAEANFIAATLEEPPFDPHPIRLVCSEKKWNPGLIFLCNNPVGGLGNLRVSILTCVRFAIEAGASLIMPHIIVRNPDDIYEIRTGIRKHFSYMFDEATFVNYMRESCPQLTIYETLHDIPSYEHAQAPVELLPESLHDAAVQIPSTGLEHLESWQNYFQNWLAQQQLSYTASKPAIIDLQRSYLQFPVYHDGADFVISFGRLLQFRRDARNLAGKVLYAMHKKYKLHIQDPSQGIYKDAFMGVHLRTEEDSQKAWPGWGYGTLEKQAKVYLDHFEKFNTSLIYVASGDEGEITRFAKKAKTRLNATTTTKFKLLREHAQSDLEALESLTWDQQAQVDFLVMLKASQFVGVGHSSFAWNVALRRRRYSNVKEGYLDGPLLLSDDLSQVAGKPKEWPEYAACMWP